MKNDLNVRLYKNEDYGIVQEWYTARGLPPLPSEYIPCPSIWVTRGDGEKLLLLVVYLVENAPVASISWAVGNPDIKPKEMYMAMDRGLDAITYICEKQGVKLLFSHLARFSRSKMLDRYGFVKCEKNVYERIKVWQN